jgi:putative heme iron utilization protein
VPPLHIKFGLIKISVRAMDKESEGIAYLRQTFSKLSEAKLKEGIFVIPQITQLFDDQDFSTKLTSTDGRAWKAFGNVCRNFLVNEEA